MVDVSLPADLEPYRRRLRGTFGYPELRDGQAETLRSLASSDVLAVMPTGSGKSLCYVLPALEAGRTLVVSPLIALMQDQVDGLRAVGVSAAFINSTVDRDERNARYRDFVEGRTPLLYVAPEGLRNQRFVAGLRQHGVNLLAIDEAHCISQWGHDFRPDYLVLGAVREQLGNPRTLALTATADPRVRRDVLERLGIAGAAREVVAPLDRPNLRFSVQPLTDSSDRDGWLRRFVGAHRGQAGIVYARTRREVERVAESLRRDGVRAEAYHAGLAREHRTAVQRRFTLGETPVIVATIAFGMGIDKPDVRYVVHLNLPGRLESYYQEAGRAGRDGEPAECVLLYRRADRAAQQRFIDQAHPDDASVRRAWTGWAARRALRGGGDGGDGGDAGDGAAATILDSGDVDGFANIVAALRDSGLVSETMALLSGDPDAPIDTRAIAEHRRFAETRLAVMVEYAETSGCRRAVILRYFGEQPPERCDGCDSCLGTAVRTEPDYPDDLYAALLELRDDIVRRSGREPHEVFEVRTARDLATYRPRTEDELLATWGIAQTRLAWFGAHVLRLIGEWEQVHVHAPERARRESLALKPSAERAAADRDAFSEVSPDDPLYRRLREWRAERAKNDGAPAFTLFSDRTLRELVSERPRDTAALLRVWGLGRARVSRFGDDLLALIGRTEG